MRPETPADSDFRYQLFCDSRPSEWSAMVLGPMREILMRQQFHAQTVGYRSQFEHARFDIIEHDKRPIGRIVIDITASAVRLVDQAIVPQERSHGFGTAVMRYWMDKAAARNLPMRLMVASTNHRARQLYLRLGFRPIHGDLQNTEMEWRP